MTARALALLAAVLLAGISPARAGTPCADAYEPAFHEVWELTPEAWNEACAAGLDAETILVRAQTDFIAACRERAAGRASLGPHGARHSGPDVPITPMESGTPGLGPVRAAAPLADPLTSGRTETEIGARCARGVPGERELRPQASGVLSAGPVVPLKKMKSSSVLSRGAVAGYSKAFLDGLFIGSSLKSGGGAVYAADGGGAVLAGPRVLPVRGEPPPAIPGVPTRRPVVWDPGRVSQADLDKHIRIDPGYAYSKYAESLDRRAGRPVGSPGSASVRATKEGRFVVKVIDRLQDSLEGRRILTLAIREARYAGKPITFQATDFPGSQLLVTDGVETVTGLRGTASDDSMVYKFNKLFSSLKDPALALETMAPNVGHELNHIVWGKRTERTLGKKYETALDWDLVNEKSARYKGYLVAAELNSGNATTYTGDAASALKAGDDYFERMKLWNPYYAARLTKADMNDPVAAFEKTLRLLRAQRNKQREQLASWVPARQKEIAHLSGVHGLGKRLIEISDYVASRKSKLPHDIKETGESISAVEKRLALLRSDKGPAIINELRRAARDPDYQALDESAERDRRRLETLVSSNPLPDAPGTPGQIGWTEFYRLVRQDKKDHPGHWK